MPVRDEAQVEALMPDFYHRHSPDAAWGHYASAVTMLGGVKAFWSMSAYYSANYSVRDVLGASAGYNLVPASGIPIFAYSNLAPWVYLHPRCWLYTDSTDLAITGTEAHIHETVRGLSIGGWIRLAVLDRQHIWGRWDSAGGNLAYTVYCSAAETLVVALSRDGVNLTHQITGPSFKLASKQWYFIAMTFKPGESLSLMVNGDWSTTTNAPDSIAEAVGCQFTVNAEEGGTYPGGKHVSGLWIADQYHTNEVINRLYAASAPLFGIQPRF